MNTHNQQTHAVTLEAHESARGNLYMGEALRQIPFEIRRFYIIKDVPRGAVRGAHAHKKTRQALFVLRGSFDLLTDDGTRKETRRIARVSSGMLLEPRVWHSLTNISSDAIILVVASTYFDESDYLRDYNDFLSHVKKWSLS